MFTSLVPISDFVYPIYKNISEELYYILNINEEITDEEIYNYIVNYIFDNEKYQYLNIIYIGSTVNVNLLLNNKNIDSIKLYLNINKFRPTIEDNFYFENPNNNIKINNKKLNSDIIFNLSLLDNSFLIINKNINNDSISNIIRSINPNYCLNIYKKIDDKTVIMRGLDFSKNNKSYIFSTKPYAFTTL